MVSMDSDHMTASRADGLVFSSWHKVPGGFRPYHVPEMSRDDIPPVTDGPANSRIGLQADGADT